MTLSLLECLGLLGVPPLLGVGLLRLVGGRFGRDWLACLGWSWMVGSLGTGLLLFGWLWAGRSLAQAPVVLLVLALVSAALGRWWPARSPARDPARPDASAGPTAPGAPPCPPRGSRLERVAFGLVLAFCLGTSADRCLEASADLVTHGDEASIWSAKAKALFVAGALDQRLAAVLGSDALCRHQDYPLLNPLLQVGAFAQAGRIVHLENRIPVQALLLALVLVAASALRGVARPGLAAVLLLLLTTSDPFHFACKKAMADHMVALGLLASLDALGRLMRTGELRFGRLGSLALAFLVWSKNEGQMLALCVVVAAALVLWRQGPRVRARSWAAWLALPALLLAAQLGFNASLGLENDLFAAGPQGSFWSRAVEQAGAHARPLAQWFLELTWWRPGATGLVFPAVLALALAFPRRLRRALPGAGTALGLALAGFALIYLGTPADIHQHLATSLERVLFQLQPLLLLWLAAALQRLLAPARALAPGGVSAGARSGPRAGS